MEAVDVTTAITWLKEHARQTFDETVELHVRLGVDPAKSDQLVRGSVVLPSGLVSTQRVAVITDDIASYEALTAAGAVLIGGDDLLKQIETDGTIAADIVVATPAVMSKVAKVAKILGPKGLMPNPKTETVTDDPVTAVKELAAGKLSFRMDQLGNIHVAVAKVSWDTDKATANVDAILAALKQLRPAAAKGEFLRSVTVCTTMSPAVRISA